MLKQLAALTDRVRHSTLVIPAAVLVAALMLGVSEIAYRGADAGLTRLAEMFRARALLLQTLQRVTAAESGKRGYLLAEGDEYLLPYQSARADVQANLRQLEALYSSFGDQPAEAHRRRIAQHVNSKLSEMEEVLRLQQSGRRETALQIVRSGIGRDQMQQLMNEGSALAEQQNGRIADGLQSVFDTLLLSRAGVATMTMVGLLVVILFVRQGRQLDLQLAERTAAVLAERERLAHEVELRTAELTELARHLQSAREDERARLARDLHDELGALLTAAKLDVARIRPKLQQALPDLMPRLEHLIESLNSGIALKRRIIEDLRPSTLSTLGLVPALEILCSEFSDRCGLAVQTDLEPVSLDASAELTLFRMVQESLTNVTKYAKARTVCLRLHADQGWAQLSVQDDGVGFDPGAASRGNHGLVGMRFRVEAERGQLSVRSAPGQGTTLTARLPEQAAAR